MEGALTIDWLYALPLRGVRCAVLQAKELAATQAKLKQCEEERDTQTKLASALAHARTHPLPPPRLLRPWFAICRKVLFAI